MTRGIRTLTLSALTALTVVAAGMPVAPAAAAPELDSAAEAIVHQVPQVPLTIDGVSVSPETIVQYNGQPLHMAVVPDARTDGRLVAFTRPADLERFVDAHGGPANVLAAPEVADADHMRIDVNGGSPAGRSTQVTRGSFLYEDSWAIGHAIWIDNGYGLPDLTQWDLNCFMFICTSWNDEGSSAWPDTGTCFCTTGQMLWEHTWWGGSSLWIPSGYWVPDLTSFGWNDRTSSFASYGP
jgi:hypothetical protein